MCPRSPACCTCTSRRAAIYSCTPSQITLQRHILFSISRWMRLIQMSSSWLSAACILSTITPLAWMQRVSSVAEAQPSHGSKIRLGTFCRYFRKKVLDLLAKGIAMTTTAAKTGYAPVHGLNMYYEIDGEGQPLVLLHGGFGLTG